MAGTKREVAPGVWELLVYAGRDPITGKKRQRSKRFRGGARAADKALAAFATEIGKIKPGTTQTLNWAIGEWFVHQEKLRRAPDTLRTYRSYHRRWIEAGLGIKALPDITPGDIEDLVAEVTSQGRSKSTARQVHAIIRGALRYAKAKRWVGENVALDAPPPSLDPTAVVAAMPEEADALYRSAGPAGSDLAAAIALGVYTGARLGELCALRWSSIDLELGLIHFVSTKTHQTGDVPISEPLAARLAERHAFQRARAERVGTTLDSDPFVLSFASDGSRKPVSSSYSHAFGRLRDELGLSHLHFHTLRHAYVTQLLAAGIDPVTVSKLVRHRDTTMIGRVYGHSTPEAIDRARGAIGRAFQLNR